MFLSFETTLMTTLDTRKITPAHIDNCVEQIEFHHKPGTTLTICYLTLKNGTVLVGESACVSPANFDAEYGRKLALDNAKDKIWPREGYLLASVISAETRGKVFGVTPEIMAKVAHEVNRAYCKSLGDFSQPAWDAAPDWQKTSAIKGAMFHSTSVGTTPEQSHENWLKEKEADGWVYGEVKDPVLKQHPCMRPYNELPVEQRAKDYLFKAVIDVLCSISDPLITDSKTCSPK